MAIDSSWPTTGQEKYPALYGAYQEIQEGAPPEPQTTTFVAQPLEIGAKEFREDFVPHRHIERALAITAIVVSVIAIIASIGVAVHFYSMIGSAAETLFCIGELGAMFSMFAAFASPLWLGSTFSREDTKEKMEEWFADQSKKSSLRAIYDHYYDHHDLYYDHFDTGIAPAVREGILTVAEGEKLSELISQYRELSNKECEVAKWLESQWTQFLYAPSAPPAIDIDPVVLGIHYLDQITTKTPVN